VQLSTRHRLKAAVSMLLASAVPTAARADATAKTQVDASVLYYGEKARTNVLEPNVRVTRLFGAKALLYGQFGYDAITGASPTGAIPASGVQTTTTPSGNVVTSTNGQVPTQGFSDRRWVGELGGTLPLVGGLALGATGHVSRERDYRSTGGTATFSLECMQKLTTLTAGGGVNQDQVIPIGGTPVGLTSGQYTGVASNDKRVTSALLGVSRIVTRRWMLALNGSLNRERGYLTEPYKVLSVVDPVTGAPTAEQLKEKRPDTRQRRDVLLSSVYHLPRDVAYASYRYYWDDWGLRSSTFDLKYRVNTGDHGYVQPHVRYYTQNAASFYRAELVQGEPLPDFATSDERLGVLHTTTYGLTYGLPVKSGPGQFFVRAEYLRQTGPKAHHADDTGGGTGADTSKLPTTSVTVGPVTSLIRPPLGIGTVLVGYSTSF
jgi:hypothetical protein